jgi:hypothetical protein
MNECCDNSGGRVRLTIDGTIYSARSAITLRPTNFEREAEANQDGTIYTTTKSVPVEAEFSLSDRCGLSLDALVHACHVDVTIEFIDMNKAYLMTQATVVGRPEIDSESGEVSGFKVVSQTIKII